MQRTVQALAAAASASALLALAIPGAKAADLSPAAPETAPAAYAPQPMELGTGWYLRGDIGFVNEKAPKLNAEFSGGGARRNHFGATVGFGYKFNNWFRADLTYDWRNSLSANSVGTAPCVTAVNAGVFTTANCSVTANAGLKQHATLANGYLDLGNWSGLSPYIGAGVGYATLRTAGSSAYLNGGAAPAGSVTDAGVVPNVTYTYDYASVIAKTYRNFAWALMAGLTYDVNANAKLDIGYRYLNSGTYGVRAPVSGAVTKRTADSHEVRVGIRYMIDGTGL